MKNHIDLLRKQIVSFLLLFCVLPLFAGPSLKVLVTDSKNAPIEGVQLKYSSGGSTYAFGTTDALGLVSKEMVDGKTYSLYAVYNHCSSLHKSVSMTSEDSQLSFQTVNAIVRVADSNGNPHVGASITYGPGSYYTFGSTGVDGKASKELFPGNACKFYARFNNTQSLTVSAVISNADPLLTFETVNTSIKVEDSDGNPQTGVKIIYGPGSYYTFGSTGVDGKAYRELFQGYSCKFYAKYNHTTSATESAVVSNVDPLITFKTVTVDLAFSGDVLIKTPSLYSIKSQMPIELFSGDVTFQFKIGPSNDRTIVDKVFPISGNSVTKTVSILKLRDSQNSLLAGGTARGGYTSPVVWNVSGLTNSDGWLMDIRDGNNSNLSYEMKFNNSKAIVSQQLGSLYEFQTQLLTVRLETCGGDPLDDGRAAYGAGTYPGSWFFPGGETGTSNLGESAAEMFPGTFSFRMQYNGSTDYITSFNFPADGNKVTFKTTKVTLNYGGSISYGGSIGDSKWFTKPSMELLPGTVKFHFRGSETVDLGIEGCEYNKSVFNIKLIDSNDNGLEGGLVTYYKSGWKTAGTTNADGNVFVMLDKLVTKLSFKMKWLGFYQQKSNVDITKTNPVKFQTVNTSLKLTSSLGNELEGNGKYYASGWKVFGSGVTSTSMELLPGKYPFKIYYEGAYKQKTHIVSEADPIVEFNTIKVTMKLLTSDGNNELEGLGKYYASGWKTFGTTQSEKELLPVKYPFKIYYNGAYKQISQDVNADPVVVFNTVKVRMQLLASDGTSELEGQGKFYASGWKSFGVGLTTTSIDMLPVKYPFKIYYKGAYQQKSQDVSVNPLVRFETIPVTMNLLASDGSVLEGDGLYYASGWKTFGTSKTTSTMELLPAKYPFKVKYEGAYLQKSQVIDTMNKEVVFNTVAVTMKLKGGEGDELEGQGRFYASGWKDFGQTTSVKELLPVKYSFKVYYAGSYLQKKQDIKADPVVIFTGTDVTLNYAGTIKYYASGWKTFTKPTMSLLPGKYPVRYEMAGHPSVRTTLLVEGSEMEKTIAYFRLLDSRNKPLTDGVAKFYNSGWKTAGNTNSQGVVLAFMDGKVTKMNASMGWAGFVQQKSYFDIANLPIIFKTVKMQVELRNSSDAFMDEGKVTYYASGWRDFGTTSSGVITKELLPGKYSISLAYAGYKQQKSYVDIANINPLVFKTKNMQVELRNSSGVLMDEGKVTYYASGWKDIGLTSGGIINKELLPGKYSFRMSYEGGVLEKSYVNIADINPLVYETVSMNVELHNSTDVRMDEGVVTYYAGGWRSFGSTVGGVVSKELLPIKYSFKLAYAGYSQLVSYIDIGIHNPLIYKSLSVTMKLLDGTTNLAGAGTYYASGWKTFGTTIATKELLPGSYSFKINYQSDTQQKNGVAINATNTEVTFSLAELKSAKMDGSSGGLVLNKVYPNPFTSKAFIEFSLEESQRVRVLVYDMKGALIRTLSDQMLPEGPHILVWGSQSGEEINIGTYIIQIRTAEFVKQFKLVKVR